MIITKRMTLLLRGWALLVTVLLLTVVNSGTPSAAAGHDAEPRLTLDPNSGPPGITVQVSGTGFDGDCGINLFLDRTEDPSLEVASIDEGGTFTVDLMLSQDVVPGEHEVVGQGLQFKDDGSCGSPSGKEASAVFTVTEFTFDIDSKIQPQQATVPGLSGGPPRPVGVTIGPDGKRDEFVMNEVILHPSSEADLHGFLAEYGGVVLHDGTPMLITEAGASPASPDTSSGDYLIRVDLSRSSLSDLQSNMTAAGITGRHLFSSNNAARLVALIARESPERQVSPNMVATPHCTVCEHPDGTGSNIDAATFPWMTEDDDPSVPGDQGLSVGVIRAWEYLAYMGLPPPPPGGSFITPVIAIIDNGFNLDTTTGAPLNGNLDYVSIRPLQGDVIDGDRTAGGAGEDWHGQMSFGTAAAFPNNRFGSAGTGGEVVRPMLIRYDGTYIVMADAVRSAALSGADVINISWGGECNWLCREFVGGDRLQADLGFAANLGVINVASAGNDGERTDLFPCRLNRVICVGAIAGDGQARSRSNFGANVDIWAPDCIRTTVTPDSAAADSDNIGLDELPVYCGTSAASPFVAGIVGLMKALDPLIDDEQVQQVLQATANTSATTVGTVADPDVTPGWIDAFRAVSAVRPNQPPVVQITHDPSFSSPRRPFIRADMQDPEPGGALPGSIVVRFSSDRDGELCVVQRRPFICAAQLSLGTHVLTATATDPFGGQGSASLTLSVTNALPSATITAPPADIQVFSNQFLFLQGEGFDLEGPVRLTWQSNQVGLLGTGDAITIQLPVGEHTVTLTVTDADGATAQDSVVITVRPGGPTGGDLVLVQVACHSLNRPVVVTVGNQGNTDASASTTKIEFFTGTSSVLSTPPIAAGETVDLPPINFRIGCPGDTEHCRYTITVDFESQINESNEENNRANGECVHPS